MSLQLLDIDPEVDFPDLTRCLLEAYEDPHQKFLHIYLPIFGPGPEARKAALEEASTRLKRWHSEDPSSHWQKIVDTTTGRIVAGASWNIHTSNPFAEPQEEEVTWFPNDTSRTFAEKALENYATPRFKAGQRPHVYLFNVFVHPAYRRRGIGQQVMNWGMAKADELGLEMFLDATPPGKPLYDSNGFVTVEENITAPTTDNPDDKWKETAEKACPFTFYLMWRPVGGKFEEGKTLKPWETS